MLATHKEVATAMIPALALCVILLLALPAVSSGQEPVAPATPACTYDVCALRVEGAAIVRGIAGEPVARLGMFRAPRISQIMASRSDSAAAYGRMFENSYGQGKRLAALGTASTLFTTVLLLAVPDRIERNRTPLLASLAVGLATRAVGARRVVKARSALHRAIWWYNRELAP